MAGWERNQALHGSTVAARARTGAIPVGPETPQSDGDYFFSRQRDPGQRLPDADDERIVLRPSPCAAAARNN